VAVVVVVVATDIVFTIMVYRWQRLSGSCGRQESDMQTSYSAVMLIRMQSSNSPPPKKDALQKVGMLPNVEPKNWGTALHARRQHQAWRERPVAGEGVVLVGRREDGERLCAACVGQWTVCRGKQMLVGRFFQALVLGPALMHAIDMATDLNKGGKRRVRMWGIWHC
jgi:hypothetical protein